MKIKKLYATFGCLDRAELTLADGLNILELPNEGGKSTWSAFLLAMFYGIDTSERAAKGVLPAKTKYKPWSGAAMEGRMELEWNGRAITVERTTKGRVPMGEFRAYETASGLPVRELTADRCGQTLLGVEKAVFERSAFLRQSGLAVTPDSALERRLGALVSTGEEAVSFSETERRLRDWRNACKHNQTGEIPRAEQALAAVDERLAQIRRQQAELVTLRAEAEETEAAHERQRSILRAIRAEENRKKREMLAQAEAQRRESAERAEAAAQAAAALPDAEQLRAWRAEWTQMQRDWRALPQDAVYEPAQPEIPAAFAGRADIRQAAAEAVRDYRTFTQAAKPQRQPFPWLPVCAAVLAVVLFALRQPLIAIAPLALAAVTLALWLRSRAADRREAENAALAAREILRRYGADTPEEITALAERTAGAIEAWQKAAAAARAEQERRRAQADALRAQERTWNEMLRCALPDCGEDPIAAIDAASACLQAARQAKLEAERTAAHCAALAAALPPAEEETHPAIDVSKYRAEDVLRRRDDTAQRLQELQRRIARGEGQIRAQGDPAELEAQREELLHRIDAQKARYASLTLAMEALERANDTLQTRFAPQISRGAAEVMAGLTGGRYEQVLLDRSLAIQARERGAVAAHPLGTLSQGTADQLYLAVRLSICRAVLPADAPLVLDDALANFDDERAARAVALLAREAKGRQILLFTCQKREKSSLMYAENA